MNLRRPAEGFTLIEMIMLIVVFFAAVTSLLSVVVEAAKRVGDNKDLSIAIQLAQEQAENILSQRRNPGLGYDSVSSSPPATLPPPNLAFPTGFSASVAVTDASNQTNDSSVLCPPFSTTTAGCKLVVITVSKNSQPLAVVTLMLADFL